MSDNKISVSLDEVNSSKIDMELNRQDVANRMAEHQEKIRVNFANTPSITPQGGFFRKAMVYMAIFGFVAAIVAWGGGEVCQTGIEEIISEASQRQLSDSEIEITDTIIAVLNILWFSILGCFISIGISIADACVSKNIIAVIKNGLLGAILGCVGGVISGFFASFIYAMLGGGDGSILIQQIFARAIAWGILGLFIAIAPGILMKSWKKFLLGLAGGFIGGLIGGILFDPLCMIFGSVGFARFVNITGMGVGAAVAMVFLENIAKQGWLKVAAGLIAGKQFILYRNPTVIGSSPKCEIYLFKDPQIAPKHAAINNRNDDFIITSINGAQIFINNVPISQQRLKTGDEIRIGNTIFVFEAKIMKNPNDIKRGK